LFKIFHYPLKEIKTFFLYIYIFLDIREYVIFTLRNLLINNPENQKLVEQLAPIETAQHPALQDAGIMTELGQDGKIKFSIDPSKNGRK